MEKWKPYIKLWASAFLLAIEDCWDKEAIIRDPAREWVRSDSKRPRGFVWLCYIFDLDPEQTRWKILGNRTAISELRARVAAQNRFRARQMSD